MSNFPAGSVSSVLWSAQSACSRAPCRPAALTKNPPVQPRMRPLFPRQACKFLSARQRNSFSTHPANRFTTRQMHACNSAFNPHRQCQLAQHLAHPPAQQYHATRPFPEPSGTALQALEEPVLALAPPARARGFVRWHHNEPTDICSSQAWDVRQRLCR